MNDPIVEEVRKHREEHTKKFNGELTKICAVFRKFQGVKWFIWYRGGLCPRSTLNDALKRAAEVQRFSLSTCNHLISAKICACYQ
jgi:hypothetical protein